MQVRLHVTDGGGQGVTHAPFMQSWFAPQRMLHAPQCAMSDATSTQLVPHILRGAAQFVMHCPLLHT